MIKKYILCAITAFVLVRAETEEEQRCAHCKKQEQKDKELQVAALNVLSAAVNGAFAVAANPDDKNSKLQFGQMVANSFIGLIATAMKTSSIDLYDAQGNKVAPEKIAQMIAGRLETAHLDECVPLIVRDVYECIDLQV